MVQAKPAPELNIPASEHTVKLSIIDSTSRVDGIPIEAFMQPHIPGYDFVKCPCYSFLIQHNNPSSSGKYDTLVFDLGINKNWRKGPEAVVGAVDSNGWKLEVQKDVADILRENGQALEDVGGIIWSHYHFDHTGDPSTFPQTTDLLVGPTFKERLLPGFPTNSESHVDEGAFANRNLREISFTSPDGPGSGSLLKIGRFNALDFYGDGSFYLLDTPGHAHGHVCGLARTSANPPEFILLGGDIAHHGGQFRPTPYLPLPEQISPSPLLSPFSDPESVLDSAGYKAIHPNKSSTEPFMRPEGPSHDDPKAVVDSRDNFLEFDAQDNILSVVAHDTSLLDVLEFYPKAANDWSKKGWKAEGRWRFLRDFDAGSEK